MTNLSKLNKDIIFRLILSKKLFKKGIYSCRSDIDIYSFCHGLITIHDALDNFTAAIIDHVGINTGNKKLFLTTHINLITEYEKELNPNFVLQNKSQIERINLLRNNIKHKGITPNISQEKAIIQPIISFFRENSLKYFDVDWELVSLVELIKDEKIKDRLLNIEVLIDKREYRLALEEMAVARFIVFDEYKLRSKITPGFYGGLIKESPDVEKWNSSKNIFLSSIGSRHESHLYDVTDFLEKKIDRTLMSKFLDLTPTVGINNTKDWKYIFDHGSDWVEENWTKDITLFCYDFLIEAIIRNQFQDHAVEKKKVYFHYRIKALDDILIYNKHQELIYTISKNQEKIIMLFSRVLDNWEIFNEHDRLIKVYEDDGKNSPIGFFREGDHEKIEFLETFKYVDNERVEL